MSSTVHSFPSFGLGTFRLTGQAVIDSVRSALELGYRAIDTAQIYGNEADIGQAIAESGVARSELFLTTKIWVDHYARGRLVASLRESLERLRTDQVDLTLIHWPAPGNGVELPEYMAALAEAKALGLTRRIGVSNFNIELTRQAIAAVGAGEISTNQIELSPYLQNRALTAFLEEQGIAVTSYMTLAYGKVLKDPLLAGIAAKHQATALNHSATHLLHAALRQVLGDHVQQKGSLVDSQRLRFDFSHFEAIKPEQLKALEDIVNAEIRRNTEVETEETDIDTAKAKGAMALFGEKYGDQVRVLSMGGDFSVELCGGTHVSRTGDIGLFKITSEGGVAAGVRRIEAVTGAAALAYLNGAEEQLKEAAGLVKGSRDNLLDKLGALLERNRSLEKELEQLKAKAASAAGDDLSAAAVDIKGAKVLAARLDGLDGKALLALVDQLKNKLGRAVILLGGELDGKVVLVAGVTQDLTGQLKAGELMKQAAAAVGGKGGGRPDMAQGGGTDAAKLDEALALAQRFVEQGL